MLILSVFTKSHEEQRALPSATTLFESEQRTTAVETAAPYGFCFDTDDMIIAGESIINVNRARAETIAQEQRSGGAGLNYGIYLIIVLYKKDNRISIHNSISSSRPYYMYHNRSQISITSSLKKLADHGVPMILNESALPELLVYRFVTASNCLVKDVRKLVGGESFEFDLTTMKVVGRRRYRNASPSKAVTASDAVERCESILTDNVVMSTAESNRPALLLSGGLDSSLLGVLAVKNGQRPDSVSSGFSFWNSEDREAEYATTVADHLNIAHTLIDGTPEIYLKGLVDSVYHAEEPVHHLQSIMLYELFRLRAQKGNDLFLCGEAADGLFGNDAHLRCHKFHLYNSILNIPPLRSVLRGMLALSGMKDYRLNFFTHDFRNAATSDRHFLHNLGQYTSLTLIKQFFPYEHSQVVRSHKELAASFDHMSLLDQISMVSLLCEGAVTMSVWSKLAEAHRISLAYPFAAENLIDYVYTLPWSLKLKEPKHLIRMMLRNNGFPESFITRPKRSFGFPSKYWALPGTLFQPLVDMASEMHDRTLLAKLQREDMSHAMLLWNLLNLYLFKKLIIDRAEPQAISDELLDRHRQTQRGKR